MPSFRCLLLLALLILGAPVLAAQARFAFATTPGALPKDIVPIEYALHVVPDVEARTFRATGVYRIEVRRETRRIVMHALDIELLSASLRGTGRRSTALPAPSRDAERQLLVFALPRALPRGRHTLELAWKGRINAAVQGLYADRYPTPAGERVLLATDMEPANARRLLPCWDEPSFRARFRVSVEVPAGFTGYSNMPRVRRQTLPGGSERFAFAPTPPMPTYLLALFAGELERVAGEVDGTALGIVVTAGKAGRAQYALEASRQLLRYFNDYFGVRYPLPKLDQIALPGGFPGGMENWGAIAYNEAGFLVDPVSSPERTRQGAFGLTAHEISHQWFGNLVTMAWWDDLWLNEAFAYWMATKASDRFHPEWRVWLASEGRELAMDLDARASTHPIHQPIATESEAERAFDRITYEKGGAFLRMLEAWLGEEPFRRGMRAYMARHRFSNTTGADLWAALGAASRQPVAAIATNWTTQPGFPLISVDARCESGHRHVMLTQEQFRLGEVEGSEARLWRIPLQVGSAGAGPAPYALLHERSAMRTLPGCEGALLVDADGVGFYRVRYAPLLFEALLADWSSLPDGARLKLFADTSALVRADQVPLANWLALTARLGDEPRFAIWTRVLGELDMLDRVFVGEPSRPTLHHFAVRLLAPRFARLGWDEKAGESAEDRRVRALLAAALSRYGDAATIAEGQARFARFVADRASLPPSLVNAVVGNAGRHADAPTWEQLRTLADAALASEEKFRYFRALAEVRDPALAERSLRLAIDPGVPQLIRQELVGAVAANGHLAEAWSFAREHADALLADATANAGGRYLGGVVDTSASTAIADELEAFVARRLAPGALIDARRVGDEIRTRARLKARLLPQLEAALPGS